MNCHTKPSPSASALIRTAPAIDDLGEWLRVVDEDDWEGLAPRSVLGAFDHFRALGQRPKGCGSPEYELARALLRRLIEVALVRVHELIPLRRDARRSERESARQTAMALVTAALTDKRSNRHTGIRQHFRATIRFISDDARTDQFGRLDNDWTDPKLRVGLDADAATIIGAGRDDDPQKSPKNPHAVDSFLETTALIVDPRRYLEFKLALARAIGELPSCNDKLIVCWTLHGYTRKELAELFEVSMPTITARLRRLARSPHLQPFRKRNKRNNKRNKRNKK